MQKCFFAVSRNNIRMRNDLISDTDGKMRMKYSTIPRCDIVI